MIRLVVGCFWGAGPKFQFPFLPSKLPIIGILSHKFSPATVSTTKDHQFSGAWAGYICEAGDNGGEEGGAGSDEMLGWMGQ